MKRLVDTSRGPVEIDLSQDRIVGTQVTVTTFRHEGWEDDAKMWSSDSGHDFADQTLAEFLARYAEIPDAEAEALAEAILGPWLADWRERGGEHFARSVEHWVRGSFAVLAFGLALALLGLATLTWLLVTRVS